MGNTIMKKEKTAEERLVELVDDYVRLTDQMADFVGNVFPTLDDIQHVVVEVKKAGAELICVVSDYTKAVERGLEAIEKLNALEKSFGEAK